MLAHFTGTESAGCSILFVPSEPYRGRSRGMALMAEGLRRQHNLSVPTAGAAISAFTYPPLADISSTTCLVESNSQLLLTTNSPSASEKAGLSEACCN